LNEPLQTQLSEIGDGVLTVMWVFCSSMLGIVFGALIKEAECRRGKKSMMMEKNQRGGRSNLGI